MSVQTKETVLILRAKLFHLHRRMRPIRYGQVFGFVVSRRWLLSDDFHSTAGPEIGQLSCYSGSSNYVLFLEYFRTFSDRLNLSFGAPRNEVP